MGTTPDVRIYTTPWCGYCIAARKLLKKKGVEYKVIDVKGCTELVGKHLKLFTDKREISTTDGAKVALSPALQELVDSVTKRAADEVD